MKKPTKPACEMCRFWETFGKDEGDEEGSCRRFPPLLAQFHPEQTFEGEERTEFPISKSCDWCGEFEEKKS